MKHQTPGALGFLDQALEEAATRDLLRQRPPPSEPGALSFCSNDYLALADALAPSAASGTGASRLVSGERPIHARLETAVAELVRLPAALAFTSGYVANLGALACLAGPGDLIVSDALNHASIIDGARLSRADLRVVPHLDVAAVENELHRSGHRRKFVVTESYFSMDADSPDLARLRQACDAHGAALLVDEAHALGVLGPDGRGLCAAAGVVADVLVGTFGKAFGAGGAFVAGCPSLVHWLWNRARPFVFSTGLSPAVAAAALQGLTRARAEPERRHRVLEAAEALRSGLSEQGIATLGTGPIVPWVLGEPGRAMRVAARLREQGIDVRAIRPPSVPDGTARLRLTVTAAHTPRDIESALASIRIAAGAGLG